MEVGILIMIILGSFIFKKGKSTSEEDRKPVLRKDMTWEEMEEYYGITLSKSPKETSPIKDESISISPSTTKETAYSIENSNVFSVEEPRNHKKVAETLPFENQKYIHAEVEEATVGGYSHNESLRFDVRQGLVWSMILEKPKGMRMLRRYSR